MKVYCTLIIRTFRGMAAAYQGIAVLRNSLHPKSPIILHPTSAPGNPQSSRFFSEWKLAAEELKRKLNVSSGDNKYESFGKNAPYITAREYNNNDKDEISRKNIPSVTAEGVVKGDREYNNDEYESLRASAKISRPPPQMIPWQKELVNKVHFIGTICLPIELKRPVSGGAYAWTSLRVKHISQGVIMWFTLTFWDKLAETAAQHLKKSDQVYVSGYLRLQTTDGEDDKAHKPEVIATTLNFVEKRSPYSSQQVVVNKNTLYEDVSEQKVVNKDPPSQYKNSVVKFSTSGKNVQEDAANIESLWRAFFASPLEWWDHRKNKLNPRSPDFEHKDTGQGLWIYGRLNPLWVRSQLAVLDSIMKGQGECERGGSSARSEGSLSSSRIYVSQDKCFEFPKGHPNSFGKNAREDAAKTESLWQAFFTRPVEWWDNRTAKWSRRSPDFKHKYTGQGLWIDSSLNPSWVKSQLAGLDFTMKVLEESGRGESSARSQRPLSSSRR